MFVRPGNVKQEHIPCSYELYHISRLCHDFQTIFYEPVRKKMLPLNIWPMMVALAETLWQGRQIHLQNICLSQ